MHATEHAPRGLLCLLERPHALAEIVERGAGVLVERRRVNRPHREREMITLAENAPRHGNRLAQQRLGFFETLQVNEQRRVVVGCYDGISMFFAINRPRLCNIGRTNWK